MYINRPVIGYRVWTVFFCFSTSINALDVIFFFFSNRAHVPRNRRPARRLGQEDEDPRVHAKSIM